MRVAFDSRATAGRRDAGHYARGLLAALQETAGELDEIVECSRARGGRYDLFHAPCSEAAMLRSPCPTVVTIHDVGRLVRRSERLRCGGVHLRLRHLALQRATRVIVPADVIAQELVAELGLEHERVVVIPPVPEASGTRDAFPAPQMPGMRDAFPASQAASARDVPAGGATPAWSWQDAARATWQVYALALAEPARAVSRRRDAISPRGSSSAGSSDPAPATSARDKGSRDARGRRSRARSDPKPATGR